MRYRKERKIINMGAIFGYFLLIVLFSGSIFIGIKVAQEIEERGLRDIVMSIWEGPEDK